MITDYSKLVHLQVCKCCDYVIKHFFGNRKLLFTILRYPSIYNPVNAALVEIYSDFLYTSDKRKSSVLYVLFVLYLFYHTNLSLGTDI